MKVGVNFLVSLLLVLALSACDLPVGGEEPTAVIQIPTPPTVTRSFVVTAVVEAAPSQTPTATAISIMTVAPTETPPATSTTTPAPQPTDTPTAKETEYRVVFVEENDVLNVREGAGVEFDIVAGLLPGSAGIFPLTGRTQINTSTWQQISAIGFEGWVNNAFLTEVVNTPAFCEDPDVAQLVDQVIEELATAADRDGFSDPLVRPNRGIRARLSWWNNEIRIFDPENMFASSEEFAWGTHPAGGADEPIEGTARDILLPYFDRDFKADIQKGCNQILHGPTAGFVKLPPTWEGINYYSIYRAPGPDDLEFDWSSWVIGIEHDEQGYFVSFLVHYEWEI